MEYDSVIIANFYLPPRCQDALITDVRQNVASGHQPHYYEILTRVRECCPTAGRTTEAAYWQRMFKIMESNILYDISTDFNTFFKPNGIG